MIPTNKITSNYLLFIVTILLCSYSNTYGQTEPVVPKMTEDELMEVIFEAESLQHNYDYYKAMVLAQDAKVVAMYYDNSKALTRIHNIIATSYEVNGELNKSFENYNKAIMHAKLSRNDSLVTSLYYNLAHLSNLQNRPIEESTLFYERIITNAKISQDTIEIVRAKNKIARINLMKRQPEEALPYLESSAKFSKNFRSSGEYMRLLYLYSYYHSQRDEFKSANKYLYKARRRQKKLKAYTGYEDLNEISSLINFEKGNFKNAYNDILKYNEYERTKLSKEKLKEINIANAKFEVENYKNNLAQIKGDMKEKETQITQWKTSIALACLVLLISLAFLFSIGRNNSIRKKLNADLVEKNNQLFEAKEAAEQLSKLKSNFVSTVSHELRTPLYGVIGLTQLLRDNPETEKRQEYLDSLKFSGNYLLSLINDVLQLSKIETSEIKMENAPFNLKILVNSITKSLHNKRHKNNNKLHAEIDPKIDNILNGDSVRLSQILINLVGNALKFTKDGNVWLKILIEEETAEQYVLNYIVKDDGVGIPADKVGTIFNSFSQVKNNVSEYQGTGLGLSIVKNLINAFGSEITVESEFGKGSEFKFSLPIKRTKQEEIDKEDTEEFAGDIATLKLNILVVDDNKINQVVTKNILSKNGYTVDIANNGLEAIDKTKANKFDLILMDINMPEMGGLEATEKIREFDPVIPIVALTAAEDAEMVAEVKEAGMNDLIVKPYDTHVFYQTIIKNVQKVQKNKTTTPTTVN